MKHIRMTKTAPGMEEGTGITKDYEKDTEHNVSDELAAAFAKEGWCEVLGDPEVSELLGTTEKAEDKGKTKDKSEAGARKGLFRNK